MIFFQGFLYQEIFFQRVNLHRYLFQGGTLSLLFRYISFFSDRSIQLWFNSRGFMSQTIISSRTYSYWFLNIWLSIPSIYYMLLLMNISFVVYIFYHKNNVSLVPFLSISSMVAGRVVIWLFRVIICLLSCWWNSKHLHTKRIIMSLTASNLWHDWKLQTFPRKNKLLQLLYLYLKKQNVVLENIWQT